MLDVSGAISPTAKQLFGSGSVVLGDSSLNVGSGNFSGVISGNGGVSVTTGTLVLTGNNTFSGQASSGGTGILQIGAGGASGWVGGNILNNGGVVFNRSDAVTYSGQITGSGALTFTGGGTYTLTTSSSFYKSVQIDAGTTVQWGNGAAAGWIGSDNLGVTVGPMTNNGTLIINRSSDRIYQGVISGSGKFVKKGSGMVALNKTSLYTGITDVEAGTLLVSGSIAASSLTTVYSGATLTGTGTIGTTTIKSGGILAPGSEPQVVSGAHKRVSSIGTINLVGTVTFEGGAILSVKVDGQGHADKAAVTGAVTIDPTAQVRVRAGNGTDDGSTYAANTTYTILTGSAGVTGQFSGTIDENLAFLDASLQYVGNDVRLTLKRNDVQIGEVAQTSNQQAAAAAIGGFDTTDPVYQQLTGMSAEQAQQAFNSISGEVHASGQQAIDETFNLFTSSLTGEITGAGAPTRQSAVMGYAEVPTSLVPGLAAIAEAEQTAIATSSVWITPLAGLGSIRDSGNAAQFDWGGGGLALGYENRIVAGDYELTYGIGAGYLASGGKVAARASSFETQGGFVGAYGSWTDGAFALSADAAYGVNNVSTRRDITVGAITRTASANYWMQTAGIGLEASYGYALTEAMTLRPVGALDIDWNGHGESMETGAGSLNAAIASASSWQVNTGLGLEVENKTALDNGGELTLKARALWQHALADTTPNQSLALAGNAGTPFTVAGVSGDRDRLVLGAGLAYAPGNNTTLSLNYSGTVSAAQFSHVVGATFGGGF